MQHIFTGSGAPSFTPIAPGHHYVDLTNKRSYISVGTGSVNDWKKTNAITPVVETFVLSSNDISNQYVELSSVAVDNTVQASVNRLTLYQGDDFSLSEINGVTRLNFLGSIGTGGLEALEQGDILKIRFVTI